MIDTLLASILSLSPGIPLDGKISCVAKDEPTISSIAGRVCDAPNIPLPLIAREFLDLSDMNEKSPGTCGDFFSMKPHEMPIVEINLLKLHRENKLPLLIKLPKVNQQSADCAKLCELGNNEPDSFYKPTTFGLAARFIGEPDKHLSPHLPKGYAVSVRVQKPWFYLVGEEGDPNACMDGRPTFHEFGGPLAALTGVFGKGLGFGTSVLTNENSYALIDIHPTHLEFWVDHCAPYRCDN